MNRLIRNKSLWLSLLSCCACGGCRDAAPSSTLVKPPVVQVALPVMKKISDHADFIGQTEAVNTVEIRARVTGYIDGVDFDDGAEVEKGALLFEIDPRSYQAELEQAEGQLAQAAARLKRLNSDFQRAEVVNAARAITREQFDLLSGDRAEAEAVVQAAAASRDIARINLGYTKVRAPIRGRIGRASADPGSLVKADETILGAIVSLDPMFVYFDLDARTMLRIRRLTGEGMVNSSEEPAPIWIGLADEDGYPHQGHINFEENTLDPSTGTLRVRGVFSNRDRLFSPGLFVRVRITIGEPYDAMLVPEQALGTDRERRYVYVVNDDHEVAYRRVEVGRSLGAMRVVTSGLSTGEKIVVSGLQRIQPGAKVDFEVADVLGS